jgi:hypothetical protein
MTIKISRAVNIPAGTLKTRIIVVTLLRNKTIPQQYFNQMKVEIIRHTSRNNSIGTH